MFENLNLRIEAGTTNAIVGPSGFGKTSMLHLLFRIYDPIQGQVFIDGQDVKGLTFESFRKHIVVVPQNGILFNDTILPAVAGGRAERKALALAKSQARLAKTEAELAKTKAELAKLTSAKKRDHRVSAWLG